MPMKRSLVSPDHEWELIESNTIYPESIVLDYPIRKFSNAKREVNKDSIGKAGSFVCEKLKRDVFFESEQEENLFRLLGKATKVSWYQEQPVEILYSSSKGVWRHYPDAVAISDDSYCRIIEVKDEKGLMDLETIKKAFAALEYCRREGIGYNLITGKNKSLRDLASVAVPDDKVEELSSWVIKRQGNIKYDEYQMQRESLELSSAQMHSFMIAHDLVFDSRHGYNILQLSGKLTFKHLLKNTGE
jgi:hypothetical protein